MSILTFLGFHLYCNTFIEYGTSVRIHGLTGNVPVFYCHVSKCHVDFLPSLATPFPNPKNSVLEFFNLTE